MLHEERNSLSTLTQDLKRATDSMIEEFQAIDWYRQRIDATTDENLKKILVHNMNEEKEHGMMLLEWIRQHDANLAKEVEHYVGKNTPDIASTE
jgi:hypothetical protein